MKSETESMGLETSREDMQLNRKEVEGLCLNTFV